MKPWRGLDKEMDEVEQQLCNVGEILSRPFHKRLEELIVRLCKFKGVVIEELIFGMGGWSIRGTLPAREEIEIGEGEKDIDIDFGDVTCCAIWDFRKCNYVDSIEKVNPGISDVIEELHEVCTALVDTRYLQYPDLDRDKVKELLDKSKVRK